MTISPKVPQVPKVPNFDMEGLKTFFTVAKCKSFSDAAELLHKTPAAISYRIRALEDQIGMPLFKRSTRTVELLPAGEHLMEFASQIYGILQEIPKNLEQLSLGAEPQYVISVNNLLRDEEACARLLSVLHRKFPYTHFIIERNVYMGVWDSMVRKQADFGIGVPSWHPISHEFETLPIGQVDWVFVCAPEHPLAQKRSEPLTNADLQSYVAINVEDTAVTLRKRTAWLLQGQREILVPTLSMKLACHLEGLGVGFLPERMAAKYIRLGKLVQCSVEQHRAPSPLAVAWQRESTGLITSFLKSCFMNKDSLVEPFYHLLNEPK